MNKVFYATLFVIAVATSASLKSVSEVSVIKGARDLRRAFNAALARIIDSGEFLEIKNRTGMDEVIACITCAPDSTQSVFPMKDSLTGRMVDILEKQELVVAGLRYRNLPAGDYIADPPVGFWPEYLRAIVAKINAYYQTNIKIKWNLFTTSPAIMDSIRKGESDMTDLYMILSSFHNGKDRIEAFSVSCSPGGYESTLSVTRASGLKSMVDLNNALETGDKLKIGALSSADFTTVKPFLSSKAIPVMFESVDEMRTQMLNGEILAGVTSTNPGDTEDFLTFRSGVVSPRAVMMLADADEVLEPKKDNTQTIWIIITCAVGVVLLVVGILVGYFCQKNKKSQL